MWQNRAINTRKSDSSCSRSQSSPSCLPSHSPLPMVSRMRVPLLRPSLHPVRQHQKPGIILVAVMSFLGAILGGSAVAFTLTGLLTISRRIPSLLSCSLPWSRQQHGTLSPGRFGLPSSSSHSLIGGLVGGGIAAAGTGSVYWGLSELFGPSHELSGLA